MRARSAKPPIVRPVVLGTGLVALDVVVNGDVSSPQMFAAGGTCGNVLTNLSFLGWESYPVARLDDDWAGSFIERDLSKWGVRKDFLHMAPLADTPIIIHRIRRLQNGGVSHSFSWSCPHCDRRLPSYRPVTLDALQDARLATVEPGVFFFDRPSACAIRMAREARDCGAMVVFELAGIGTPGSLAKAIEVAHIVKYAEERAPKVPELSKPTPFIEVKTLGARGLAFRCNLKHCKQSKWMTLGPYKLSEVKDAAGAGDWCTAGLIHRLGAFGQASFVQLRRKELQEAFRYAQALAAINCCFEGARGSMYALPHDKLEEAAQRLVRGVRLDLPHALTGRIPSMRNKPCPICGTTSRR